VVPKFQYGSSELSRAPVGVNFSSADKGLHVLYSYTKFGVRIYIHSNVMEGSQILNLGRDPDHAHFRGQFFVVRWLVHVALNMHVKYDFFSLLVPKI